MSPAELKRITAVRVLVASGKARDQRKARHLSLKEVAESIGTSRSTLYRWETGTATPNAANALRWADALEITVNDSSKVAA
ncbi:helix-turn-helix transcriptional regulator [Streptomyces sp. NPDC007117]|uniref:helix-turn-helix domain-containing protein n=1 Tax=Streptomyces sp. NPDC007117 TaxID=3154314 RepID=UPI0034027EE0